MSDLEPSLDPRRERLMLGVGLALVAAYFPTLASFPVTWARSYQEHGFIVAAIVAWLLWRDRGAILHSAGSGMKGLHWMVGVLSVAWLAFMAAGVGVAQQLAVVGVLTTWALAVFGRGARVSIVSAALTFTLALPLWGVLIPVLQRATTLMSGALASALGASAVIRGDTITIESGTFLVESGCSGINYLMAGLTLGAAYGQVFDVPRRTKVEIVATAGAAAIFANWMRVAVLVLIGDAWGIDSPLIADHLWQGWLIFSALMVPTYFVARALERRAGPVRRSLSDDGSGSADPTLPRRAAKVGAFAVIGPALYFGVGALPHSDVDRSATPLGLAPAWTPAESALGPDTWVPAFVGLDESLHWTLPLPGGSVDASRLLFVDQRAGEELIQWNNAIAPDSLLVASRLIGPLGPERRYLREAIVRESDRPRIAWYWYRVGGIDTPFAPNAKLLELFAFFRRSGASELVVLSATCEATTCADAAERLRVALEGDAER